METGRELHREMMRIIAEEIEKTLPPETAKDLRKMSEIQTEISLRLHTSRAVDFELVQKYNELCYKHFAKMQDGEEFHKDEPEEKPVEKTARFDFGEAIRRLKQGEKLTRDGWNGKNQFIALGMHIRFDVGDRAPGEWAVHGDIGSKAVIFFGTRGTQVGWLASQADMLAEDWHVVEKTPACETCCECGKGCE